MLGRRRVRVEGEVYRRRAVVTRMRLEIWIYESGVVVGTARTVDEPPYPHTYAVPDELIMRDPKEPPFRLTTDDGGTIVFHIGSSRDVIIQGKYTPPLNRLV